MAESRPTSASLPAPAPAPAPARQGQPERRFVQLPFDAERSSALGYAAGLYRDPHLGLDAFAPDDDCALASFITAFAALLHRFTHQAMIACDIHREQRLAVDCEVDGDVTLATLSARVAAALLMATSGTGLGRGMANVAVSFTDPSTSPPGAEITPYDLNVFVHPAGPPGRAGLTVRYNERLFKAATVQRLMGSFQRVLDQARDHPDLRVGELALLSPEEEQVLRHDSGTAAYDPVPVFRMVEQHARARPEAVAARLHAASISYGELDQRSNQLAHLLQARGVGVGARVAVCLGPSFDVLVSMLAIWKVGAIYVPLDPTHPEALIAMIVDETQPAQVLTLSNLSHLTQPQRFPRFCFDLDRSALATLPTDPPPVAVTLAHASHMFYTSGTTGRPKGVVATHGNLAHYVHVAMQAYRFRPDDVFISVARYTFSISLFELLCPLCSGASVRLMNRENVLAPESFAKVLEEVTVLHCGPSLMGSLFRYLRTASTGGTAFPRMRHASAGGDLVPPHIQDELKTVFPNAELFVIYGCTEISVMGCTYPIPRDVKATRSFVGKPFPDTAVRVMDARGALVPIGVVGEICFSGKGVTRGYYQRDELTAQKYVEREGRRFYTTGDMGRVHPDGNVEILGRRDFQVQVRGVRIELAGIENTVRELGLAGQCAVVLKKLDEQDVRLVAFVAQVENPSVGAFRRALAARLPEYMLPQHLVILEALPLTANGKLDRDKLALLPWDPNVENSSPAGGTLAQRTPLEQQIAETMARVLKCSEIGPDADFFDQGGDSLSAVLLLLELENVLGIKLSPDILFEHSTVRALAAQAKGEFSRSPRPLLLNGSPDAPAVFMLLGVHLYRELARRLEGRYAAYGVYAGRELLMFEAEAAGPTVQELAADYIEIIRQQQPHGPYRLVGMSFGGVVAYEVAQQLRCQGEEVAFLGLLDAVLPEKRMGRLMRLVLLRPVPFLRALARRFLRRFRPQPPSPRRAEFTRYDAREQQSPLDSRRQAAYRRAMWGYLSQVRPWKGDATLVVSGQRLARDPLQRADCGWTQHVARLDRHTVDADHLGLLEKPKVAEVSDILLAALERAEATKSRA